MAVTSAIINFSTSWLQKSVEDTNSDNTVVDVGKITYQQEYPSGLAPSGIDVLFHDLIIITTGSSVRYDLTNITGEVLGTTFTKVFSKIKSITINNTAGISGDIGFDVTSSSGFNIPLGSPTGVINISPNSLLYFGTQENSANYTVNSSNKEIVLTDVNSKGPSYQIIILGNT